MFKFLNMSIKFQKNNPIVVWLLNENTTLAINLLSDQFV